MNSCTFCGRLVADAEIKATNGGTELCKFRLASDVGWGDRKQTHWLDCVIFGQRGQALQPHLGKGQTVTVVGELEPPRMYEAKNGETRAAQSLVVREIALQGRSEPRGGDGDGSRYPDKANGAQAAQKASQATQAPTSGGFDDDIPFDLLDRGLTA